jgi:hypothetical protein
MGSNPKSVDDTYTIPHRETVAGEALFKFSTSNTILQFSLINIRSPFAKVKILLSSRTVFRFSIQMASTGPSQTIQVKNLDFLSLALAHNYEKTPGVQSSEISDFTPYISSAIIAFGFILFILKGWSVVDNALVKMFIIVVFPDPVGPTNMKPCLTLKVSYSYMIFKTQAI